MKIFKEIVHGLEHNCFVCRQAEELKKQTATETTKLLKWRGDKLTILHPQDKFKSSVSYMVQLAVVDVKKFQYMCYEG